MSAMKLGSLVLAATMLVLATGCGGGGRPGAAPAPPSTVPPATVAVTTPSSTAPATGLPEGTYRTGELTVDQLAATALAAGFARADVDAFVAGDGIKHSAVMTLRLAQGGWTLLLGYDGQPETIGWEGSYQVVDDHTVVAKDSCGPVTFHYAVHGDQLSLKLVSDECPGMGQDVAGTIIYESSPFTRVTGP